jgi:hypothetical protein
MKAKVTHFKSLEVALKELEPFIRNGQHLFTGKPFKRMEGLRSRELLANWLLCAAVNSVTSPGRLDFSTDPDGGDGLILDTVTGEAKPTEHVLARRREGDTASADTLILNAITAQQAKGGKAYASGKTLVIFAENIGQWHPNLLARQLPPHDFEAVWVIGLQGVEDGEYVYNVTRLNAAHSPAWRVYIAKDFASWRVEEIQ